MYHHVANIITFFRMGAGAAVWYFLHINAIFVALLFLTAGEISDFYDGYFARRFKSTSNKGSFLDPLADKILVIFSFSALCQQGVVGWWVLAVIVARDLFITGLRMFFVARGAQLQTVWLAKCKTVVQFGSLYLLIIGNALTSGQWPYLPAYHGIIQQWLPIVAPLTAIITAASALVYLPPLWRLLTLSSVAPRRKK